MAHSRKLMLMIGESGSGKSTWAKQKVAESNGTWIRVNRDDLRIEFPDKSEREIEKIEKHRAAEALAQDINVLVDNTHLNPNTVEKWRNFANHKAAFDIYRMTTPLHECRRNDAGRSGKACVGRSVIERQFLSSGRLQTLLDAKESGKKIVIVDVDGTVADMRGVRGPFEEHRVFEDKQYQVIIDWVNALAEDHIILFVSGRHSTCGPDTCAWLSKHDVLFDHIFMRHSWDDRSDVIVKQEILDAILQYVPKSQIAFVLDDRPKVVSMWKKNGLTCYPVRGTTHHNPVCPNFTLSGPIKTDCQHCGAIGDF